jgi:hypothetical protein
MQLMPQPISSPNPRPLGLSSEAVVNQKYGEWNPTSGNWSFKPQMTQNTQIISMHHTSNLCPSEQSVVKKQFSNMSEQMTLFPVIF